MKIELEIDDTTARVLVSLCGEMPDRLPTADEVAASALRCISRYRSFPSVVERKHLNALAIVRAKAVEAAATSTTEAARDSAQNVADRLFDFMIFD